MPSWGVMIAEGLPRLRSEPYLALIPSVVLSLAILALTSAGEGIAEALASLDSRSRRVIEARWLDENSDGSVGTATLHELAKEFGVSAERIRQIEAKALRKMRGALSAYA